MVKESTVSVIQMVFAVAEGVRKEEILNGYLLYPPFGNSIHLTFSQPL